jgi:hypothetical protein
MVPKVKPHLTPSLDDLDLTVLYNKINIEGAPVRHGMNISVMIMRLPDQLEDFQFENHRRPHERPLNTRQLDNSREKMG